MSQIPEDSGHNYDWATLRMADMNKGTREIACDGAVLLSRLRELGDIGRDEAGRLTRLAVSDADKEGRDRLVRWFEEAGLEILIDRIGNIFGAWNVPSRTPPLMIGSHIDTVIDAGIYDGCYGVLAGLSVLEACRANGVVPDRPLVVAGFTNEEGVRYTPDMMGSLVYAGGLDVDDALSAIGVDGTVLGEELTRIGYAGAMPPGQIVPSVYIEAHIEQGPVLEAENTPIGAVENLQGISWQKFCITGVANHAGTTPTSMRADAGLAAAKINTFLRSLVEGTNSVATIGTMQLEPNAINVIPNRAVFTVDMRNPSEGRLRELEIALAAFVDDLARDDGVSIETEYLARFSPVEFDEAIVERIRNAAERRGLDCKTITSGAGHDAQMMSRLCPSAMIFVPSRDGISHNPREFTDDRALIAGADVLLDTVLGIVATRVA